MTRIKPFSFKHESVVDLMGDFVLKINQIIAWINSQETEVKDAKR